MSTSLTSADKKFLRGKAQTLKPAIHIGKNGLTESLFSEIDLALEKNQLIKIQFHLEREALKEASEIIEEQTHCTCIGQIGRTASFYRPARSAATEADDEQ